MHTLTSKGCSTKIAKHTHEHMLSPLNYVNWGYNHSRPPHITKHQHEGKTNQLLFVEFQESKDGWLHWFCRTSQMAYRVNREVWEIFGKPLKPEWVNMEYRFPDYHI